MANEQLKGHLELLLLEVVAVQPLHGYDVLGKLRDRSGGVFDLPEGTIYPALHRLEKLGLLDSAWSAEGGRRRRVYTLTGDGRRALAARKAEWKRFSLGMQAVLGATS
jgi:PadR family transcriptional regulator PadR